jgi:hypothetical protein
MVKILKKENKMKKILTITLIVFNTLFLGCTSVNGTGGNSIHGNGGNGVSGSPTTGSTVTPTTTIDVSVPIK